MFILRSYLLILFPACSLYKVDLFSRQVICIYQTQLPTPILITNMAARPATLGDKLILIPHVVVGLSAGLLRLATRPITNDVKPPTAFKDFVYAVFRHVLARVTITQEKWLTVPTEKTYLTWAAKKNLQTDTAVLGSGLKVHWIGKPSSEKVFLYFHGGGYVNPITPQHLDWLLELQTDLSKTKSVAIAVVGYTCSPEGQYPLQLREGAESLLWLLNAQGKKPEDVGCGFLSIASRNTLS